MQRSSVSIISFWWKHVKPYKGFYLTMIAGPFVAGFYPFAYNYAVKLFVDAVSSKGPIPLETLVISVILFLGSRLMMDVAWRVSNMAEWKAEPYVRQSLILESYDYVQHHSYKFFQDTFVGAVTSKFKGLLDGYDKFWGRLHHQVIPRILKGIISFFALSFINIYIGWFVFIWSFLYIFIIYKLSQNLHHLLYKEMQSRHTLLGKMSDNITNIFSLFSFSARQYELQNLNKHIINDLTPKNIRVQKYDFKVRLVGDCLSFSMFVFIVFYMIYLKATGCISMGDFAFVFGIFLVVSEDLEATVVALQDLSHVIADLKSSLSILLLPQDNLDSPNSRPWSVKNPTIEFKNVSFGYRKENFVFKNFNLNIQAGEKIGLVGRSGAGKSSLINLLLKYFKTNKGEIFVDNQNINEIKQDSLREAIGFIPQDIVLFHRTLRENIRYGNLKATDEEIFKAAKDAHIHDFIMELPSQYDTYVGERGIKLSGGQRQRIAIARAILKDAPILVLDEATSSLDSHTEKLIQDSLNTLIKEKQKTVIAIAHRLSTLKHMDRIVVLDKGVIVEEGTHQDLLLKKKSIYKKLWKFQEI